MVPTGECQVFDIPVIYIQDVVAWIYQCSKCATEEFSTLSPISKYCVGLTCYAQNPLSEHAVLGADITAISFEDEDQHLILKEKLLIALERVLVDMTNKVGMEINYMVMDSYYQHLLPLVCGLGPRKANTLVRKIATLGGILVNHDQFIKSGLLTTKIFLNAAGFLHTPQDSDMKSVNDQHMDEDGPDPLDATCIQPEDYKLA
ncbi:hypothetical protein PISMIDRAFT_15913 [Pisolithus microcarpus 441]|uniref:Uncharacterized protein n=1 Tax=Pisolithus microcarpus 441 TaxID=765257 RepID=A0A0C9XV66_9AGAM|nr:helix-hairpin-helix motif-domain-containing protein [Pisolithus microcarpus]KIK16340.1 hypothetical protein PISMIDRAFT_15913 [Pisolithus microcarpus 441]